jgi:glycosyltransferase involved in cell wall biosynthesis
MRIGENPNRRGAVPALPEIVTAVITHLPNTDGYHSQRFEIVRTCLNSMRDHSDAHVLIWDNGSAGWFLDWLRQEYQPDTLIISANVGKSSARASIFNMFPGKTIIALCDDDMFFYPDWLDAQINILKTFPNVGAVSGYPVRTQQRWGCASNRAYAREHGAEYGRFIIDDWERDFCASVGREPEGHLRSTAMVKDMLLEKDGVKALAFAHHCQFVAFARRIAPLTEWNEQATSNEQDFDNAIDRAGYLRLTTPKRYARHMGNVLDETLLADVQRYGYAKETTWNLNTLETVAGWPVFQPETSLT